MTFGVLWHSHSFRTRYQFVGRNTGKQFGLKSITFVKQSSQPKKRRRRAAAALQRPIARCERSGWRRSAKIMSCAFRYHADGRPPPSLRWLIHHVVSIVQANCRDTQSKSIDCQTIVRRRGSCIHANSGGHRRISLKSLRAWQNQTGREVTDEVGSRREKLALMHYEDFLKLLLSEQRADVDDAVRRVRKRMSIAELCDNTLAPALVKLGWMHYQRGELDDYQINGACQRVRSLLFRISDN